MSVSLGALVLVGTFVAVTTLWPAVLASGTGLISAGIVAHACGTSVAGLIERAELPGRPGRRRLILSAVVYVGLVLGTLRTIAYVVPALLASGGGLLLALAIAAVSGTVGAASVHPLWKERTTCLLALLALAAVVVYVYAPPQ